MTTTKQHKIDEKAKRTERAARALRLAEQLTSGKTLPTWGTVPTIFGAVVAQLELDEPARDDIVQALEMFARRMTHHGGDDEVTS